MTDLAAARAGFLDKVEGYAPGQAARFAPALDDLIRWSEDRGLVFDPRRRPVESVRFADGGSKLSFWTATPRTGDGAKLTLLDALSFPEPLRAVARDELARIDRRAAVPDAVPVLAFTQLIWEPYRARVLDLMGRMLDGLRTTGPVIASSPAAG